MASTSATTSHSRISRRFDLLRSQSRKALVCYVTAGHPDPDASLELVQALAEAGADVIELGVPFSDPIADGPVIQASSQAALAKGMTLDRAIRLASEARSGVPVVLFSYLNPILAGGPDVLERCRSAGIDGVLVTDLPVGADVAREEWLASSGLDFIRLVAPTTPEERMREIGSRGSGFVYLISRLGVTGARSEVPAELRATVARLRGVTELPVCVGFGVSTADQARTVGGMADGVVVGSAIVAEAGKGVTEALALVRKLRAGLDS